MTTTEPSATPPAQDREVGVQGALDLIDRYRRDIEDGASWDELQRWTTRLRADLDWLRDGGVEIVLPEDVMTTEHNFPGDVYRVTVCDWDRDTVGSAVAESWEQALAEARATRDKEAGP